MSAERTTGDHDKVTTMQPAIPGEDGADTVGQAVIDEGLTNGREENFLHTPPEGEDYLLQMITTDSPGVAEQDGGETASSESLQDSVALSRARLERWFRVLRQELRQERATGMDSEHLKVTARHLLETSVLEDPVISLANSILNRPEEYEHERQILTFNLNWLEDVLSYRLGGTEARDIVRAVVNEVLRLLIQENIVTQKSRISYLDNGLILELPLYVNGEAVYGRIEAIMPQVQDLIDTKLRDVLVDLSSRSSGVEPKKDHEDYLRNYATGSIPAISFGLSELPPVTTQDVEELHDIAERAIKQALAASHIASLRIPSETRNEAVYRRFVHHISERVIAAKHRFMTPGQKHAWSILAKELKFKSNTRHESLDGLVRNTTEARARLERVSSVNKLPTITIQGQEYSPLFIFDMLVEVAAESDTGISFFNDTLGAQREQRLAYTRYSHRYYQRFLDREVALVKGFDNFLRENRPKSPSMADIGCEVSEQGGVIMKETLINDLTAVDRLDEDTIVRLIMKDHTFLRRLPVLGRLVDAAKPTELQAHEKENRVYRLRLLRYLNSRLQQASSPEEIRSIYNDILNELVFDIDSELFSLFGMQHLLVESTSGLESPMDRTEGVPLMILGEFNTYSTEKMGSTHLDRAARQDILVRRIYSAYQQGVSLGSLDEHLSGVGLHLLEAQKQAKIEDLVTIGEQEAALELIKSAYIQEGRVMRQLPDTLTDSLFGYSENSATLHRRIGALQGGIMRFTDELHMLTPSRFITIAVPEQAGNGYKFRVPLDILTQDERAALDSVDDSTLVDRDRFILEVRGTLEGHEVANVIVAADVNLAYLLKERRSGITLSTDMLARSINLHAPEHISGLDRMYDKTGRYPLVRFSDLVSAGALGKSKKPQAKMRLVEAEEQARAEGHRSVPDSRILLSDDLSSADSESLEYTGGDTLGSIAIAPSKLNKSPFRRPDIDLWANEPTEDEFFSDGFDTIGIDAVPTGEDTAAVAWFGDEDEERNDSGEYDLVVTDDIVAVEDTTPIDEQVEEDGGIAEPILTLTEKPLLEVLPADGGDVIDLGAPKQEEGLTDLDLDIRVDVDLDGYDLTEALAGDGGITDPERHRTTGLFDVNTILDQRRPRSDSNKKD
jgi:hypothetical protein